jgi:DNA-binding CsgD family transcriptional regulator
VFDPFRRLRDVPATTPNVIILSQYHLVQELLGELLRSRCGAHVVARVATLDQPAARLPEANVLVYEKNGFDPGALGAYLSRLRAARPGLRVVGIDEASPDFSGKAIIDAVRGPLASPPLPHEALTPVEFEVMLGIASGQRNADLARRMRRSSKTIEKHRANLLRKLGLRTIAQLTAYAIHNGLLRAEAIIASRRQG